MKDLHRKYLDNELSADELLRFRAEMEQLSDREVEARMEEEWLRSDDYSVQPPEGRIAAIRKALSVVLYRKPQASLMLRIMRVAVALLIPVLLVTTFYFYRASIPVVQSDMIVSAGKGERVSVVLPDGSKVRINALSSLRYDPATFNREKRQIRFDGEAFFEVASNKEIPFLISTSEMDLRVLGTTFNLRSRDYEEDVEVVLREGHVLLSSVLSQKQQELFGNQKAVLCKETGLFTVFQSEGKSSLGWIRGELVFKNRPLEEVLQTIETNYDVSFHLQGGDTIGKDRFTGTMPNYNLDEVLEILQKSYGFTHQREGRTVNLSFQTKKR